MRGGCRRKKWKEEGLAEKRRRGRCAVGCGWALLAEGEERSVASCLGINCHGIDVGCGEGVVCIAM